MLTILQASNPSFAVPQPSVASAPASGLASALEMILALALVLAVIFALAWLLRRLRMLPSGRQSLLRSEAELQIGDKERVVVVAMGEHRWLLGVTASSVTVLRQYQVESSDTEASGAGADLNPPTGAMNFAALLRNSLGIGK